MSKKLRTTDLQADKGINQTFALVNHAKVQRIKLHVGGFAFHTSDRTLLKDPHSKLADLLQKAPDTDGIYRIDYDPKYFSYLLNYLRDGVVDIPEDEKAGVKVDAMHFGLTKMVNWMSIFRPPEILAHEVQVGGPIFKASLWLAETWGRSFSITFCIRLDRVPAAPTCILSAGFAAEPHQPLLAVLPAGCLLAYHPMHPPSQEPSTCSDDAAFQTCTSEGSVFTGEWLKVCYVFDQHKNYLMTYINQKCWSQAMPPPWDWSQSICREAEIGLHIAPGFGEVTTECPVAIEVQNLVLHHKALIPEEVQSIMEDAASEEMDEAEALPHKAFAKPAAEPADSCVLSSTSVPQVWPGGTAEDMEI